jgi:nitroreductase
MAEQRAAGAPFDRSGSDELAPDLGARPLPEDTVGLLAGITTTRAIRRYLDEPVSDEALRAMLFAATRGPSGSNRQPFRFIVLTDGPNARAAKRLIGEGARRMWAAKRAGEGYDAGSGAVEDSPKARMTRTMQQFVDEFERIPVLILVAAVQNREIASEAASVFPGCQNLLLAARALGYGGAMTGFHPVVEAPLRELLQIPDGVVLMSTITLGRPVGHQGPVRRRPIAELVYGERWELPPDWAVDPPGTAFVTSVPPRPALTKDQLDRIGGSLSS